MRHTIMTRPARGAEPARRAMTLVEMLVVLSIILLMTAITVPMMRPMLDRHQVAEGARNTQVFLNRARIRAVETQRPCGVRFEVFRGHPDFGAASGNQSNVCLVMRQLESPPPYGGLSMGARIRLQGNGPYVVTFSDGAERAAFEQLVQRNDTIQFNYQGNRYRIVNIDTSGDLRLTLDSPIPQAIVNASSSNGLPFTVFRSPKPSSATPAALPRGAVIDLKFSGQGPSGHHFAAFTNHVDIIFSPSGAVESVNGQSGTDPIYLLVGRWDQTFDEVEGDPEAPPRNWEDARNFWLTITPGTGLVSVNPAKAWDYASTGGVGPTLPEGLRNSRLYAQRIQDDKGGK